MDAPTQEEVLERILRVSWHLDAIEIDFPTGCNRLLRDACLVTLVGCTREVLETGMVSDALCDVVLNLYTVAFKAGWLARKGEWDPTWNAIGGRDMVQEYIELVESLTREKEE